MAIAVAVSIFDYPRAVAVRAALNVCFIGGEIADHQEIVVVLAQVRLGVTERLQ